MTTLAQPSVAAVLDLVGTYLSRFIVYPQPEALRAHVLWCAHTHLLEQFDSTPRLVFTSADPGSGKSRALELTELFAFNATHSVGGSTAWMVRTSSASPGTMLIDEYDTIFALGRNSNNEFMRAILNAGHRRGPTVGRVDKLPSGAMQPASFDPFGAVALAGLGSLPATIRDRSIIVRMRPPGPGERPSPWRSRDHGAEAAAIFDELAGWAASVAEQIADARPALPPGIVDRKADVWEPLIAVADAAGGDWPAAARRAATWFVENAAAKPISWGVQLLEDIRKVYTGTGTTALWTADLLEGLRALPESPWDPEAGGYDLKARDLARMLGDYDIRSRDIRQGDAVRKGYERNAFLDAWARHLTDPEASTEQQPPKPKPGPPQPAQPGAGGARRRERKRTHGGQPVPSSRAASAVTP